MRVFVIDDNETDQFHLHTIVAKTFPSAVVLPDAGATFNNWADIQKFLTQHLQDDPEDVVLFDLAIGSSGNREALVTEGVKRCAGFRNMWPHARFVACTQLDEIAEDSPYYRDTFNGLIAKQRWDTLDDDPNEEAAYVGFMIKQALPPSHSEVYRAYAETEPEDSLALRLFESAFGEISVSELVFRYAKDWSQRRVRGISGGYSGAYVLEIAGTSPDGYRAVIVKVARERGVIEAEITSAERYAGSLGALTTHVIAAYGGLERLKTRDGYYIAQASVQERDLLQRVRREGITVALMNAFAGVVSVLRQCCEACGNQPAVRMTFADKFTLSKVDKSRFRSSLPRLIDVAHALAKRGLWPRGLPAPELAASRVSRVVDEWEQSSVLQTGCRAFVQHGDANPTNILLGDTNFTLIDLARVGPCPVGYDLARLAIQLRLRLPDADSAGDEFPDRFPEWVATEVADFDADVNADGAYSMPAMCDRAFSTALEQFPEQDRDGVVRGYLLGSLFDVVKIVSYGDASVFKRTWALIECYRLAARCGLYG